MSLGDQKPVMRHSMFANDLRGRKNIGDKKSFAEIKRNLRKLVFNRFKCLREVQFLLLLHFDQNAAEALKQCQQNLKALAATKTVS